MELDLSQESYQAESVVSTIDRATQPTSAHEQDHVVQNQETDSHHLLQDGQGQEAATEVWQSQTFQHFECTFTPSAEDDYGTVRSFSTKSTFNSTVGESRFHMGIKDDILKMTNGRENNFFKSVKCYTVDLTFSYAVRPDSATCTPQVEIIQFIYGTHTQARIYCGSNNMIQIFDTTRPGRDSQKKPTVPTRKSRKGQKGVISCLAFNPDQSDLYAAGSFLKTIGLYDSRAEELLLLLRDKSHHPQHRKKSNAATATGHDNTFQQKPHSTPPMGGLTQLQFSPDGLYLYSASRQDPFIRCWDIRNTAHVLHRLERQGEVTNQRLGFDISRDGKWLTTGDMNGDISIFDLTCPEDAESERLVARFHGHDDVVSAAAFHPSGSMLATSSGQRKYELGCLDMSDSDSDSDHCDEAEDSEPGLPMSKNVGVAIESSTSTVVDNSIHLWSLPGEYVWYVNGQKWVESGMDMAEPPSGEPDVSLDDQSKAVAPEQMVEDPAESARTVRIET
ncbi:Telomerase Cajal body protein 1 [Mortierella sp. GBA30]|nr:Telomerase Cajal body protein 1 [Mortierella sp. GBA30]